MGALNTRLQQERGVQLGVRLGIHTGLVVIGALGEAGRQEQLALGETPNLAARIQGLAQPNTLVISDATARLVQGYFACQDLGAQALRGVIESLRVYQVLRESGATSRLEVAQPAGLTPLVGRESEVTLLLERWEQVKTGHGQVVLLSGEAGIGKSRLVQMLKEHVANEPHTRWECRSSPYFEHTALFPLTDLFQRLLQFHAEETPEQKLGKLEHTLSQYRLPLEESVSLLAPLLSLPLPVPHYPARNLSPQRQRQRTLETIVALLLERAENQPMLFIVEDLHWTDPTSLELIGLLLDQTPTASLLVLLMCRPHFQPAWHHRSYLTEMTVHRLSPAQVEQIIKRMTDGKTFPAAVLQQIIAKTDGVPLFVEEITKALLESGQFKAVDGHYELTGSLSTVAIPATLQDSLMARLDRLVTAKGIAQLAAVIGRHFAYDVLSTVSQLDEATLQRELGRLVEAEIVYQRGVPPQSTYVFKHALIQDAAYESLLKSTRQQYHQRIAQVLEAQFPETAEAQPELLAHHYTTAGLGGQALPYWHQAGQRAAQRSAYVEAVRHFHQGLAVLALLPETPERRQYELALQIGLGPALMVAQGLGAPEVRHTYDRARALCQDLGDSPQLLPVLAGLHVFYRSRAEYRTARELAEQYLSGAQRHNDQVARLQAHQALAFVLLFQGDLVAARSHFEHTLTLSTAQQHPVRAITEEDYSVVLRTRLAWVLWCLGYPDQALRRNREGLRLAQELAHPFTLACALHDTVILHQCRREASVAQEYTVPLMALATEQGFPHLEALGRVVHGGTLSTQGHSAQGLVQMQQGLAVLHTMGIEMARPYFLIHLAAAYGMEGQPEGGLQVLAEALAIVRTTGEEVFEPERYRLKGELVLQQAVPDAREAERCFQQALDVARRQEAKSLELRAAMSLSRLWQQQGNQANARALLAPIYGWFTEGFDTTDLREAKALLEALP
jgi:predicted ATPase